MRFFSCLNFHISGYGLFFLIIIIWLSFVKQEYIAGKKITFYWMNIGSSATV